MIYKVNKWALVFRPGSRRYSNRSKQSSATSRNWAGSNCIGWVSWSNNSNCSTRARGLASQHRSLLLWTRNRSNSTLRDRWISYQWGTSGISAKWACFIWLMKLWLTPTFMKRQIAWRKSFQMRDYFKLSSMMLGIGMMVEGQWIMRIYMKNQ
jgi:hypothetical protein